MGESVNKKTTLFITASGSFLIPFMGTSVNIALPSMGRELTMDAILLSWVSTGYLLSAAMFLVPLGRVADIHGRKKIFTFFLKNVHTAFLIFTLLCTGGVFASLARGKAR